MGPFLLAPLALCVQAGVTGPELPTLEALAAIPAPVGHEQALVQAIAALLPATWRAEAGPLGSLVVRRSGEEQPPSAVVAVGIDEPGYVVSQIRDDGFLRLRTLGVSPSSSAFHLDHEGRPVRVLGRSRVLPGVILVDSLHLRGKRPEALGEEHLYLDVGAASAAEARSLGIELLDPVVAQEVARLADGRVAGSGVGRRSAVLALLECLRRERSGEEARVAFAFVAQSLPGEGPLGRGGEALARKLALREAWFVRTMSAEAEPFQRTIDGVEWTALDLLVEHPGTPIETVAPSARGELVKRVSDLLER